MPEINRLLDISQESNKIQKATDHQGIALGDLLLSALSSSLLP